MTTTYPADQVATVRDPDARTILTTVGLPADSPTPFKPADALRPLEADPRYLVIGRWGREGILIAVDTVDGPVVGYTPWHPEIYQVSTSPRTFVDSLNALTAIAPLSEDNPSHGSFKVAGEHALAELLRVDPDELSDPDSFWLDYIDDVKNGDFA
jgi:hypothetical protein